MLLLQRSVGNQVVLKGAHPVRGQFIKNIQKKLFLEGRVFVHRLFCSY